MFERSLAYLNWRYMRHPLRKYSFFELTTNGGLRGVVVLRELEMFGQRLVVVTELHTLDRASERTLMRFSASFAWERSIPFTLAINNTLGTGTALRAAFFPVPNWALPKRQILMGNAFGEHAETLWRRDWRLQIGDWDGL